MREVQEICAFINDLQARFLGVDTDTYVQTEESLLRELYSLQEAVRKLKVNTLEDYLEGMKLKSLLSSLFCYCFNNGKEEYQKVGAIEAELGKKLLKFARNYGRIKDKRLRAIAKYMITCSGYYWVHEDVDTIIEAVKKAGILWKKEGMYLITGLHYAVGDNSFTIGKDGREYRDYVETCAIQAFYVNSRWQKILSERGVEAPPLPDFYEPTDVQPNMRYCARVYLSSQQFDLIPRKI